MVLLAAPGWEGAPLPKMPGRQDCHPLPHLEGASKREPRVHGPSRPHRVGVGHQGSSWSPGFEVQVEASVWVQGDACESVQGPSHCCCSQDVRLSPEAVIWSEGRDSQGETQVSTHRPQCGLQDPARLTLTLCQTLSKALCTCLIFLLTR